MDETFRLDTILMDKSTLPTRKKIIFFYPLGIDLSMGKAHISHMAITPWLLEEDKMSIQETAQRLEELRAQIKILQTEERECKQYLFEQAPEWFANPVDKSAETLTEGDVTVTLTWGSVSECTRKAYFEKRVQVEVAA